ncbi:hypothetical protein D6777_01175 [Candidatus Woesearchaeota archaeon]|nr:MAG: hypothetical protein D6777_01175 [Candidatus Woesearchaeota archaeon]
MIGFTYDQIVAKIKEEKGLTDEEIFLKVKEKLDKLSDLISKEGAAHIVATELGVNLYNNLSKERQYQIKELTPMMRNIIVAAKVLKLYDVRAFTRNDKENKVASMLVGDETGRVRIVVWDEELIKLIENNTIKEDSTILVKGAYVRENNGFKEVHLGSGSSIEINPENVKIESVNIAQTESFSRTERKFIKDLNMNDVVEVYGTVVNFFEPRFYTACKECNKKVNENNECPEHGKVETKLIPILNFILDDGTDNIRVVLFRDSVNELLSIDDVSVLKDNAEKFREVKDKFMLETLDVRGRVVKNEMFDRLELNAFSAKVADPKEVAKFLEK